MKWAACAPSVCSVVPSLSIPSPTEHFWPPGAKQAARSACRFAPCRPGRREVKHGSVPAFNSRPLARRRFATTFGPARRADETVA